MKHAWHCLQIARGMCHLEKAYHGPLWIQLGLSDRCNHRCIMCWDHPARPRQNSIGRTDSVVYSGEPPGVENRTAEFMDEVLLRELVRDLERLGTRRIELAGRGEPTLHPAFDAIVANLKSRRFKVGVVTNASLLDRDRCRHLVRIGLDRLVVSLNAGRRETYPRIHTTARPEIFDQIIQNLRELQTIKKRAAGLPKVMLSFVISRFNRDEAMDMITLAANVGAEQAVLKYAVAYPEITDIELDATDKQQFSRGLPRLEDHSRRLGIDLKIEPPIGDPAPEASAGKNKIETIYSRIPCYIGWLFVLVTADGTVYPCCQCRESLGHLTRDRFADIWFSPRADEFRRKMKRFPQARPAVACACADCSFEKINTSVYNLLHFYHPLRLYAGQRDFSLGTLLPAIMQGKTIRGARRRQQVPEDTSC